MDKRWTDDIQHPALWMWKNKNMDENRRLEIQPIKIKIRWDKSEKNEVTYFDMLQLEWYL